MNSIGNKDLYRTLRNIFYIFCGFVLFNHTIRIMAMRASTKGDILSYAGATTVKSLDVFRRRLGDVFSGVKKYCPDSVQDECYTAVDFTRDGIGLK